MKHINNINDNCDYSEILSKFSLKVSHFKTKYLHPRNTGMTRYNCFMVVKFKHDREHPSPVEKPYWPY